MQKACIHLDIQADEITTFNPWELPVDWSKESIIIYWTNQAGCKKKSLHEIFKMQYLLKLYHIWSILGLVLCEMTGN